MGRPPKYKTATELQDKIDTYFASAELSNDKITITGLVLACGFESRQAFYHLEKKVEFCYTIKSARLKIENHYEGMLHGTAVTGPIFALKNLGWIDSQSIDHTTKGEKIEAITGVKIIEDGASKQSSAEAS